MSEQNPTGATNFGSPMNNSTGNQTPNQQMNMNMNMNTNTGMPNQMDTSDTPINFNQQPGSSQQSQPSQQPQPPQPMQSPNIGRDSTTGSGLSHGRELGQISRASPQHQMEQQVDQQQQQTMCSDTSTTSNRAIVSDLIRSLLQPPKTVAQPIHSPKTGLGSTSGTILSQGSEMQRIAHATPQHQMEHQAGQQQQKQTCLKTPTKSNPGSISAMTRNLLQPPGTVGQPMQSPTTGVGSTAGTGLSQGSEMGQIAHAEPHHQMEPQVSQQQQQSMCLDTPTKLSVADSKDQLLSHESHPGSASSTTRSLLLSPGTVAQSQPPSNQLQQQQQAVNILSLCLIGQETVQDISSRLQEVTTVMKTIQPPNNNPLLNAISTTKKKNVTEQMRCLGLLFKRLRVLYDKLNDNFQQDLEMKYVHLESLIPMKDKPNPTSEPALSEEYKKLLQEKKELTAAAIAKNKQLKEIIFRLRRLIWELNTMVDMARTSQ